MMDDRRNELLRNFIQRSLSSAEERLRRFVQTEKGELYPRRYMFNEIENRIDAFRSGDSSIRWLVLTGLRGMGKTTLLAQTYRHLIGSGIPRTRVLYVSVEDAKRTLNGSIDDLMIAYENVLGKGLENLGTDEKTFLLLDEAHYDPEWDGALKSVYERAGNVFILVTGSSALALNRGPDTARRALVRNVPSLSFTEYAMLSKGVHLDLELRNDLENALMSSDSAEQSYTRLMTLKPKIMGYLVDLDRYLLQEYLQAGSMAFAVGTGDRTAFYDLVAGAIDRIVSIDLPTVKNINPVNLVKAMNLLTVMALADRMSMESMTRNLEISKTGLLDILEALEKADVIYRIRPFGSESTRLRKTPKYKFSSPAMRAAILNKIGRSVDDHEVMGWLMEDIVSSYLKEMTRERMGMRFYYDHDQGGADFIVQWVDREPLVIEVGYGKKGSDQVMRTAKKAMPRYSLLISDGELHLDAERNIVRVPKDWFLMCR